MKVYVIFDEGTNKQPYETRETKVILAVATSYVKANEYIERMNAKEIWKNYDVDDESKCWYAYEHEVDGQICKIDYKYTVTCKHEYPMYHRVYWSEFDTID